MSGNTITPPVPVKPTTKAIPVRGAFKVVPKNIVAPKSIPKFGLRERQNFQKAPLSDNPHLRLMQTMASEFHHRHHFLKVDRPIGI